jgi:ribonuclease Z
MRSYFFTFDSDLRNRLYMSFEITILGCGSASPTSFRNPSAQVVQVQERSFLIDCGEGTQVQIRRNKIRMQKINHIFISHLHGDHYFGLVGLLSTFHLLGREKELHVYGPEDLKNIIYTQLNASKTYLKYELHFHALNFSEKQLLFEDKRVEVYSFPMRHSIEVCGFLIQEKTKPRKINRKAVDAYEVPVYELNNVKDGADYTMEDGQVIDNAKLTFEPNPSISYAYCSDTFYYPLLAESIQNVSLLYHEATFGKELEKLAKQTKHSTAEQAALIAKAANAKQLLLGHYSARYIDLNVLLDEATEVFENTLLASDGMKINL